jgi:tRNA A-37 threonylcarbamoyl transferase component Bud32/tetratricopeptide (TPR) repeat protein
MPRPDSDPAIGTLIGDRYRVIELVGSGGVGTVYRAEHVLMKKAVALKLLHPELGRIEEVARRFEREAQSASRLSHPHIIQVTDFGRTPDGILYLVMELLVGESLAAAIERSRRIPVERAVGIMRQVLSALKHAHALGVVHRDLKPENIMLVRREDLGTRDNVKLLDFGIAKMSEDAPATDAPLTQAGIVFGTPRYMSPEQAVGENTDHRSDLYSCGVILYEMLTGRRPFDGDSAVKIIASHLTANPTPLRAVAPEAQIPRALDEVVLHALAKSRDERVPSAAEFEQRLAASLGTAGASDHPSSTSSISNAEGSRAAKVTLWARLSVRAKRLTIAGGGLAAVLLALVLVNYLTRPSAGPTASPPPLKRVDEATLRALKLADDALKRGDLLAARAVLTEQLGQHPEVARVHYLVGNLDFVERQREAGLDAYRRAIELDPSYRADKGILVNLEALLGDKRLDEAALDFLIDEVGVPAKDTIARVASFDNRPELRQQARSACDRLGCAAKVDRLQSYVLDLAQGQRCEDRREAVHALRDLNDPRAIEPLRRARRRGGELGRPFGGGNACIKRDLDEAIAALGG